MTEGEKRMKAEDIAKVNETLKSIDVKGKGYVQVTERIKAFRAICPNGTIKTEIINYDENSITMMTSILDEDGKLLATGYAREERDASFINKYSYVENSETSAVGRALGMLGIGIDASMASADEVANAINNQNTEPKKKEAPKIDTKKSIADEMNTKISAKDVDVLMNKAKEDNIPVSLICELYNVKILADVTVHQFKSIKQNWSRIKQKSMEGEK